MTVRVSDMSICPGSLQPDAQKGKWQCASAQMHKAAHCKAFVALTQASDEHDHVSVYAAKYVASCNHKLT